MVRDELPLASAVSPWLAAVVAALSGAPSAPTMFDPPPMCPLRTRERRTGPRPFTASCRAAGGGRSTAIADLDALVAQVVVSNQTVRAAEARLRQAQALVDVARAPSFISVDIAGTNQKIGLTAGWEVDLWGRIRRSVEASEATAESSADDLAAATLSLQAQVAQSYFLLARAGRRHPAAAGERGAVRAIAAADAQPVRGQGRLAGRGRAGGGAAQFDPGAGIRGRSSPGRSSRMPSPS